MNSRVFAIAFSGYCSVYGIERAYSIEQGSLLFEQHNLLIKSLIVYAVSSVYPSIICAGEWLFNHSSFRQFLPYDICE